MEKLSIERVVRKIADMVFEFTNEDELNETVENWLKVLESSGFYIESESPVSFDVALKIAFIIGVVEGFVNKDIIRIEENGKD